MNKQEISNAILKLVLQKDGEVPEGKTLDGVLSKDGDNGFLFEEAAKIYAPQRNRKLFSGDHISLVHQRNGRYAIFMKKIDTTDVTDRYKLVHSISDELLEAFSVIK